MSALLALLRKELLTLFASPIAYAALCAVTVATGLFFFDNLKHFNAQLMMMQAQVVLAEGMEGALPAGLNVFDQVFLPTVVQSALVLLVVVPLVTMRAFCEERTRGTDELLLTLPLSSTQVVAGKFLATLVFLVAMLVVASVFPALTVLQTEIDRGPLLAVFVGMLLLACGLGAIGLFCSTLTANQLVAALGAYAVSLALFDLTWLAEFTGEPLADLLGYLSLQTHFVSFPRGVIGLSDLIYFASLCLLGFLLARVSLELEKAG